MDKVAKKYEELLATNPSTAMEELATYTKTLPEFEAAKAIDGAVVAHFKDHRPFVFIDNFKSDVPGLPEEPVSREAGATPMPGNKPALLLQSNLDDTQGNAPYMAKISQMLSKRGYNPTSATKIDVETLKSAGQGLGVFYIHTHGTRFFWHDVADSQEYGLVTDTLVNDFNEQAYEHDLRTGRLIYSRVKSKPADADGNRGRYCITSRFVSHYLSFQDRGLVYINACSAATQEASWMRGAFIEKGAGTFIGYNGKTSIMCYPVAAYFFDRMLGANIAEPPTPAGRPFKIDEVWQAMSLKKHAAFPDYNYLRDPVCESDLMRQEAGTELLVPNIKGLKFFYNNYMAIMTDVPFGSKDVQVTINGQKFPYEWIDGQLIVQLESDTVGDVQLEVNGWFSNKRPIVSWKGLVTYEQPIVPGGFQGTAKLTVKYNIHLRADAYEMRNKPDGPLVNNESPFYAAMDTKASYEFSGTAGPATWTGSGTFPYGQHPGPGNLFGVTRLVLANEKRIKLLANFWEPVATIVGNGASVEQPYSPNLGGWEFHDLLPVPGREIVYRGWYMELDDNLNIKAKNYDGYENGILMHSIHWPQMQANTGFNSEIER